MKVREEEVGEGRITGQRLDERGTRARASYTEKVGEENVQAKRMHPDMKCSALVRL